MADVAQERDHRGEHRQHQGDGDAVAGAQMKDQDRGRRQGEAHSGGRLDRGAERDPGEREEVRACEESVDHRVAGPSRE